MAVKAFTSCYDMPAITVSMIHGIDLLRCTTSFPLKNQSNTSSFIRNRLMQGSTRKAPPRSFGAHGTLDAVNRNICAKLGQNGIHVCLQPVSILSISLRRLGIFGQPMRNGSSTANYESASETGSNKKKSIGKGGGQGQRRLSFRFRACHNLWPDYSK